MFHVCLGYLVVQSVDVYDHIMYGGLYLEGIFSLDAY